MRALRVTAIGLVCCGAIVVVAGAVLSVAGPIAVGLWMIVLASQGYWWTALREERRSKEQLIATVESHLRCEETILDRMEALLSRAPRPGPERR